MACWNWTSNTKLAGSIPSHSTFTQQP